MATEGRVQISVVVVAEVEAVRKGLSVVEGEAVHIGLPVVEGEAVRRGLPVVEVEAVLRGLPELCPLGSHPRHWLNHRGPKEFGSMAEFRNRVSITSIAIIGTILTKSVPAAIPLPQSKEAFSIVGYNNAEPYHGKIFNQL